MKRWIKFKAFVKQAWDDGEPWLFALLNTALVIFGVAVFIGLVLLAVIGIWIPLLVALSIVMVGVIYLGFYFGLDRY